jgi:alkanesulfonate monooxygenase
VSVYVAPTEEEARAKLQQLNSLIHPEAGLGLLGGLSGEVDLSRYPLDGPFPELPKTEGMVSRQQMMVDIARKHGFSIRQLYEWVATARGHWTIVGTRPRWPTSCRSGSTTRPPTASTCCRRCCPAASTILSSW